MIIDNRMFRVCGRWYVVSKRNILVFSFSMFIRLIRAVSRIEDTRRLPKALMSQVPFETDDVNVNHPEMITTSECKGRSLETLLQMKGEIGIPGYPSFIFYNHGKVL